MKNKIFKNNIRIKINTPNSIGKNKNQGLQIRLNGENIIKNGAIHKSYVNTGERETALWKMKIVQMLVDLKSMSKKAEAKTYRRIASEWLSSDNADFLNACILANEEYSDILELAQRIRKDSPYLN